MTEEMNMQRALAILGLEENATLIEIRKAFRKKALETHPDRNQNDPNASDKYREVQSAFDLLVFVISDNVRNNEERELRQLAPNEFDLKLTLEEIFRGGVKERTITRKLLNPITGEVEEEEATLQVPFAAGVLPNTRIILRQEGDRHLGQIPANVVFITSDERHPHFKRVQRVHLEYTAELTAAEACFGRVWIPSLENVNDYIQLDVDEVITPNTDRVIQGRGLPHPNGRGSRGDIKVKFQVFHETNEPQDSPVECDLSLTLEQILHGYNKIVRVNRLIVEQNGDEINEEKLLFINVRPGTPEGTKFRFYQKGNKLDPNILPADIIFIVRYKLHPVFKQNGLDIEYTIVITTSEAQNSGVSFEVPTLVEEEKFRTVINEEITTETIRTFAGYGLPHFDEPQNRGDLILKFKIIEDCFVDEPFVYNLNVTLENIMQGFLKRVKITRAIIDNAGKETTEDKILEIDIKPGTETGTRFTFSRMADQYHGKIPGDIEFIICVKPHSIFKRNGANIEYFAKYSQTDLQIGGLLDIPTLDEGVTKQFSLGDSLNPEMTKASFPGLGLPFPNNTQRRGHLIVRFEKIKQDPPVERFLYLTEKQMLQGVNRKVNFTRKNIDFDGNETIEHVKFIIEIEPGTDEETRKTFHKAGDQSPVKVPPDLVYVIKEKCQNPPIKHELWLTLEEVLHGCFKQLSITRSITSNNPNRNRKIENKVFDIKISPGIARGTKIVRAKEGDRMRDRIPADIIIVIREKSHETFERIGVDLKYIAKISSESLAFGLRLIVPTLEKENIEINLDEITSTTIHRIANRGLPHADDTNKRGDLIVHFEFNENNEYDNKECEIIDLES